MSRFTDVTDYLRRALAEGALATVRRYVIELEQIYDKEIKRHDANTKVIASLNEGLRVQTVARTAMSDKYHALKTVSRSENGIIQEQAVLLGKLKTEVEQARTALHTRQEAHLKTLGELETMREQRIKEKQALFHERYSAGPAAFSRASTPQDEAIRRYCPNTAKEMGLGNVGDALVYLRPSKYSTPNTKTPDHTWRANPDKKWETSYTKRVVDGLRDMRERIVGIRDLRTDESRLFQAAELLTDYHSTMHDVYEERDAAQKGVKQARAEFDLVVNHRDWLQTELDAAKTGRASAIHEHTIALNANNALLVRVNSLVEERDFAKKQHEAALASFGPLNKRISDLIKERDAASATVKARIREAVGL